jgi:hypothetical protein
MSITVGPVARAQNDRIFFTGLALACALTTFIGFAPSYFMRSAELTALRPLYQIHGALFTSWMLLLAVQTSLVAGRRTDIHRRLGILVAVVAALVFIVGVTVSIETLQRNGGPIPDPRVFLSIPLGDIIVFGALVSVALLRRADTETHKRLMMLATISLLTAAVARFFIYTGLAGNDPSGVLWFFGGTDAFVLALALYDYASRGRIHPATLWGGAAVVVFKPALLLLAFTPPWQAFAAALR